MGTLGCINDMLRRDKENRVSRFLVGINFA